MQFLSYLLFRGLIFLFWIMPFWVMYRLADTLRFFLERVFKYRYVIIHDNLVKSFPEKSEAEIAQIMKGVYRNFADILLEGIKGMSMSDKSLFKRYRITNPELLNGYFERGQNILVCTGHYCNWEWGVDIALQLKHYIIGIYKPMKNQYINDYIEKSRSYESVLILPIKKTFEYLETPPPRPRCMVLIADQSPSNSRKAHWVPFLNQDTAFLTGPDTIARQYDLPLFFAAVERIKRGHYEVTFSLLHENPTATKEEELTLLFSQKLEEEIRHLPDNWLWTHRRWKKKRTEGVK